MKKVLLVMLGAVPSLFAMPQNIQDAKKLIYYEKYKTAENSLQQLVKTEPANAEAWYWLSQACLPLNEVAELRNALSAAPAETRKAPYYQVAYGHLLLAENKKDSAAVYFQQALDETKEKDANILAAVANAHITTKAGDGQYAAQLLEKATKREKKDPYLYTLWGDAYRKQGLGSEAYKTYQQALDNDNKYAPALYRMGKIFVSQKNPEMYLDYFNKTLAADSNYTPALYELYYHYYFTDAKKAMDYFTSYMAKSDRNINNDYLYTDLLYLNKQYDAAISNAQQFSTQVKDSMPRLYKLMAYSYAGLKDTANALTCMSRYFAKEADSNMVAKDFETMATLYDATPGKEDSAIIYYAKTVDKIKDSNTLFQYYKKLADLSKNRKDYAGQANWLGKYYLQNSKAGNVDLFNWGIANIKAENYVQADTVFGLYIEKYPEQSFGYYWRARANAAQDTTMEKGLAVPWYTKLIEVLNADTTGKANKKWEVEAYGYLAAYETNVAKDYKAAIEKLHKILEIDPANKDAQSYISILEKKLASERDTGSTGGSRK
jgi:tetratricopeptide (TPR) repeat protein